MKYFCTGDVCLEDIHQGDAIYELAAQLQDRVRAATGNSKLNIRFVQLPPAAPAGTLGFFQVTVDD